VFEGSNLQFGPPLITVGGRRGARSAAAMAWASWSARLVLASDMQGHAEHEESRWELGYVIDEGPDEGPNPRPLLRGVGPISIRDIRADNRAVHEYQSATQLGQSVWMNVDDFLSSMADSAARFYDQRTFSPD
jgi:hypothetical protein